MTDTPVIRVVAQRHDWDCGVAVLAMLLEVTYEKALVALGLENAEVVGGGISVRMLRAAARRLGFTLTTKREFDPESDCGILWFSMKKCPHDHVAVLWSGIVIDTDGTLCESDVYLINASPKKVTLFVAEPIR